MKDRLSVYNVKLVPIRIPLVAIPVRPVLMVTTNQRKARLGASHVNQVHIKVILEEPCAIPALWANISLIGDSQTVLSVLMAIPQVMQIVYNVLKVRKNFVSPCVKIIGVPKFNADQQRT
jgi:hypothetical protein